MKRASLALSVVYALAFSFGSISFSHAALLLSDSFEYTPETPLLGNVGGSGWGGNPWTGGSAVVNPPGGLTYPGYVSTGSAIFSGGQSFRNFEAAITPTSGTVYMSFLMNQSSVAYTNIGLFNTPNSRETTFGDVWDGSVASNFYSMRTNSPLVSGTDYTVSTVSIVTGVTQLMVMELDYSTPGQTAVYVYLNPDVNVTPTHDSLSLVGTFTLAEALAYDHIRVENFSTSGVVDEIRLGNTYFEVINAVPEPSTVALTTLGMFGMLFLVRRRHRAAC